MAQTSMQEMIEWATSLKDKQQQCIDWIAIKNKAEELLEMERQQIIKARMVGDYFCDTTNCEQYYNETYSNNSNVNL